MCIFRKYRDIFGKARTGVHADRIFKTDDFEGIAKVDFVLTAVVSLIIGIACSINGVALPITVAAAISPFFIGFIAHALFCVNTTINKAFLGEL
jgi:hypothetical protein